MIGWTVVILWVVYGGIFFVAGGLYVVRLMRRGRIIVLPD